MKYIKLGDISSIATGPFGSQLHQSDYSEMGTPVVMPKDLLNGSIVEEGIARVSEDHVHRLKRHILHTGNIVYARRGDVGRCAYVSNKEDGWLCGTGCFKVEIDTQKALPKFVFFQCQDSGIVEWIKNRAIGATLPNLNTSIISRVPIFLPPFITQQKIASILSAYDFQIEKNQKRIKLLEQMAENLYKEWFVRFRFPGYETAEFEGGMPKGWISQAGDNRKPKGWTYGELNQLGTFSRGKNITSAEMIEGQVPVISAGLEPSGYHNQSNVSGPCLTISSSGANAGYLKYNLTDIWAADCSYYNNLDNIWFVYSSLKYLQPVISNLQCGAAQPHVYPKDVNRLCVILPPKGLIAEYNKQCSLIFKAIHNLNNQISLHTHQRDLLLPRLMSGKLDVTV